MEIRNLYEPFELESVQVRDPDYKALYHKNTFFEMVFVLEGKGTQIINEHRLPYSMDKLFLVYPQDVHGFEVEEDSKFFIIRFNDSFLKTQSREWVCKLELIFHNYNHLPGCILKHVSDKPLVRALVEALEREQYEKAPERENVETQLVNMLITIAARNIRSVSQIDYPVTKNNQVMDMLNYIHQHIYEPEQLKAEKIAKAFHVSPTYISEYFKTQTGKSLQEYTMTYKMKLIETRLRFTNMQINEIVNEFGFSDASHLNRMFKKYRGISPTAYKKEVMK